MSYDPVPTDWPLERVIRYLKTNLDTGLDHYDAQLRLETHHDNNIIPPEKQLIWYRVAWKEMQEPLILLLLVVGVLYAIWGEWRDALVVYVAIILVIAVEIHTDYKAKVAISELKKEVPAVVVVRRDNLDALIPLSQVVPGDIVELVRGHVVPADGRVLQDTWGLAVDESAFTGESLSVYKALEEHPDTSATNDDVHVVWAGTVVSSGRGAMLVTATGKDTKYARMLAAKGKKGRKEPKTPLQLLMKGLAKQMSLLALFFSIVIPIVAVLGAGVDVRKAILAGASLAFATIPEELPLLVKMVLAVGARAMAKHGVLVRKLRAADALGGVDVIITDKTGTLTNNKLEGRQVITIAKQDNVHTIKKIDCKQVKSRDMSSFEPIILASTLTMDPSLLNTGTSAQTADLHDVAVRDAFTCRLLPVNQFVNEIALQVNELVGDLEAELAFDAHLKFSGAVRTPFQLQEQQQKQSSTLRVIVWKGAPESILPYCTHFCIPSQKDKQHVVHACNHENSLIPFDATLSAALMQTVHESAAKGQRVLAYAYVVAESLDENVVDDVLGSRGRHGWPADYTGPRMVFAGMFTFEDCVRDDVYPVMSTLRKAGVRVIVASGDHEQTVYSAARMSGIASFSTEYASTAYGMESTVCNGTLFRSQRTADGLDALTSKYNVYARMTPDQKLSLVESLVRQGHTPLFIGDGVNDTPALEYAPVSIAVANDGNGSLISTSSVFSSASLAILQDDKRFSSLPLILLYGRQMRDNLSKAVAFYLCCKLALILLFVLSISWFLFYKGAHNVFPMQPVHIILVELFMDIGAGTAFIAEPAELDVLDIHAHVLHVVNDYKWWKSLLARCVLLTLCVTGFYVYGSLVSDEHAITLAFLSWLLGHIVIALVYRTQRVPLRLHGYLSNIMFNLWAFAVTALILAIHWSERVRSSLSLVPLDMFEWSVLLGMLLGIFLVLEGVKQVQWMRTTNHQHHEHQPLLGEE